MRWVPSFFPFTHPSWELEIRMPQPQQSAPSNPGASSTSKSDPKAPTSEKSAKALKGGGKAKEKKSTSIESASEPTPKSSAKSSATSLPVDPSKGWMEILGCGVLRQEIIESGLFRYTPFVYCYSIAFLLSVSVFYIKLEIINYFLNPFCLRIILSICVYSFNNNSNKVFK